jgi:putative transposase
MRVQKPTMGERRTLYGKETLTGADHPKAPGQAEGRLASGSSVQEVARDLGISEPTFHRWRNRYGGMSSQEAKRLKELEQENARLKKLLAEKELDIDILKEVNRGNF